MLKHFIFEELDTRLLPRSVFGTLSVKITQHTSITAQSTKVYITYFLEYNQVHKQRLLFFPSVFFSYVRGELACIMFKISSGHKTFWIDEEYDPSSPVVVSYLCVVSSLPSGNAQSITQRQ